MSQIKIDCPRCDQPTNVDMDQRLTGQRCEHCGSFLYTADTGVKVDVQSRKVRRKHWHSITGTAARDLENETIDTTDAFQRRGWQAWYVPTFIVALVAMIAMITFLVRRQRAESRLEQDTEATSGLQTSLQKAERDTKNLVPAQVKDTTPPPEWAKQARDISSQFLRATTAAEILPLVRNQASFVKQIEAYASKPGNLPIAKAGVLDIVYAPEEAGKTGTLAMLFFENNEQHVQGLVLADTPEGLLVDWPSFSGEGDMSIAEFLEKKPTEPTLLRVAARLDDYYNFEYQNRDLVTCVRLTDYPETVYFYGYVLRSMPQLKSRIEHLPTQNHGSAEDLQTKPQPLTIKARFHAGTRSENQVEITEIIGNGWFVR
jgi:type II secretory pathway pseudopilin PulG